VLPDAFLVRKGSGPQELAYRIHTDIGRNYITAINAKTKKPIGHDYRLDDGDVIKIVAKRTA
jgi:ribosome-binding ATPase YchF (GTP1/OBG family)